MKITYRLYLSFLFVSLLAGIVGIVGTRAISHIRDEFVRVGTVNLPMIEALEDLKSSGLRVVSSTTEYVLIKDASERIKRTDEEMDESLVGVEQEGFINSAIFLYQEAFGRYERLTKEFNPNDKKQLYMIKDGGEKVLKASKELVQLKKIGARGEGILRKKEDFERRERYFLNLIGDTLLLEKKKFVERKKDVESAMEHAIWLITIIASFIFLMAMIFGSLIVRSITRPLRKIKDATRKVAEGQLDTPINIHTGDEIEDLAISFNKMMSDLRNSEKSLRNSEERLRLILDSAAEAIYGVDVHGNCTFCNTSCLRVLGYSNTNDLLGKNMHAAIHHSYTDGTPFSSEKCQMIRSLARGEGIHVDHEVFWRADGTSFPVEYWSHPQLQDGKVVGAVVTFLDITERRRAQAALFQSEEYLKKIFNSVQVGIMLVDAETRQIIDVNPVAVKMFGSAREDIVGTVCHRHVCPAEKGHCPVADLGQVVDNAQRVLLKSCGDQLPIIKTVVPIVVNYRKVFLETFIDISERQEAEQKLAKAYEELQLTQAHLVQSEKLASIGQLAAGVAHEINNPVGFVSGNLQVLGEYVGVYLKALGLSAELRASVERQDWAKAEDVVREIKTFEESVNIGFMVNDVPSLVRQSIDGTDRIKKIVSDLKIFARDDGEWAAEPVKIEKLLDIMLAMVQVEYEGRIEVQRDYADTPLVRCNERRIGQVFTNLLVNAGQSIEGKGTVGIKTYVKKNYVCIDVSDTGSGINAENLKKIFDPFFTTKPVGQGVGLGLSMSYDIVKRHQGEIRAISQVGKGTTFTVMLPFAAETV